MYIAQHIAQLDKGLCAVKPIIKIRRTPRSLAQTRNFWKGDTMIINVIIIM